MANDGIAVAEAELDEIDLFLNDRRRVDRALPNRPGRQTATARFVTGKGRLVDEQDACSGVGEPVGGGRPGGTAADHEDVEALHLPQATILDPGGVPERPKGTGCKPVGSAYGGSNPPAPTHSLSTVWPRRGLMNLVLAAGETKFKS